MPKSFFSPFLPEDVAGLLESELEVEGVVAPVGSVVGGRVHHLRDELVHEAQGYGGIGLHDGVEGLGGVLQMRICELEERER